MTDENDRLPLQAVEVARQLLRPGLGHQLVARFQVPVAHFEHGAHFDEGRTSRKPEQEAALWLRVSARARRLREAELEEDAESVWLPARVPKVAGIADVQNSTKPLNARVPSPLEESAVEYSRCHRGKAEKQQGS